VNNDWSVSKVELLAGKAKDLVGKLIKAVPIHAQGPAFSGGVRVYEQGRVAGAFVVR
jgi:hypothetical protein